MEPFSHVTIVVGTHNLPLLITGHLLRQMSSGQERQVMCPNNLDLRRRLYYQHMASMHVHDLQIIEEGWTVHVRLFGDWDSCVHGDDDSSWLEVASAAAFGQVGLMWARELLHTGRAVLGWDLLRCVEAACVRGGLGDSHENLIEVPSPSDVDMHI
jgi:hypothetical protein